LPNNYIPKSLIPLENIFDNNDIPKNSLFNTQQESVEDYNIGTHAKIKNVKILASLPKGIKDKYYNILKHYKDVFA